MVNFFVGRNVREVTENAIREKRSDGHVDETEACETGKSIHQTNESVMPYPPPLPPSFRRHSSLGRLHGRFGPLYRFNGSSGTHRPAKERRRTRDRRTNGDGETKDPERKEPRQKNEDALFYPARTVAGNYGAKRGEGGTSRVERTEGTTRGGVVGCGQICWRGWFLLNLYFINYVLESGTHTQLGRARVALASFSSQRRARFFNDPPSADRKL